VSEINLAQPPLSEGSATLPVMGHLLGYARVSTTDQHPQLQVDALTAAGCYRVFTETASGALPDRPTLAQVLDQLRPGDTLVVWKLDWRLTAIDKGLTTAHRQCQAWRSMEHLAK
jgi:predicted site-specific integrase-resolvase